MQIIYDGRKVQIWEFVFQGLNIEKRSIGKHCDGVAVVKKNVKAVMCQKGGTLPLSKQGHKISVASGRQLRLNTVTSERVTCFPVTRLHTYSHIPYTPPAAPFLPSVVHVCCPTHRQRTVSAISHLTHSGTAPLNTRCETQASKYTRESVF